MAAVLALQRGVGNAAVARLLGGAGAGGPARLARCADDNPAPGRPGGAATATLDPAGRDPEPALHEGDGLEQHLIVGHEPVPGARTLKEWAARSWFGSPASITA